MPQPTEQLVPSLSTLSLGQRAVAPTAAATGLLAPVLSPSTSQTLSPEALSPLRTELRPPSSFGLLRGATGLDGVDRGMFARFVAAGEIDMFEWPGADEQRLDPNHRKRLSLQRGRRARNVAKIAQLDVRARASLVQASKQRGHNRSISHIPTNPPTGQGLASAQTQHGAGAPKSMVMYSVQTLALGASPVSRQHDLRTSSLNSVLWRTNKWGPSPLTHLDPSATRDKAGGQSKGTAGNDVDSGASHRRQQRSHSAASAPSYSGGGREGSSTSSQSQASAQPQPNRPSSAFPARSLTRHPRPRTAPLSRARVAIGHGDDPLMLPFQGGPALHSGFDPARSLRVPVTSPRDDSFRKPTRAPDQQGKAGFGVEAVPPDVLDRALEVASKGDEEAFLAYLRERHVEARKRQVPVDTTLMDDDL